MDCASTDVEDTGSDSIEVDDSDVAVDSGDDSSAASGSGTDSYDDTSWDEATEDSDSTDDCGDSDTPDVAASTGTVEDEGDSGDHCAPAATHPSLGDPSLSDPSVPEQVAATEPTTTGSTSVTPAAASAGGPLVPLPDHAAPTVVTPGVYTPTSFDAAGNATHVSYSGVINPPTTMETFGGTPPPGLGITHGAGTHVSLDYVPQQVPRTDGLGPSPATDNPVVLGLRDMVNQDTTNTILDKLDGVHTERIGGTTTYFGAGEAFDNRGDAATARERGL